MGRGRKRRKRRRKGAAVSPSTLEQIGSPNLPLERRKALLDVLKHDLDDPGALAESEALPPADPLRLGAKDVAEALAAVCSGMADRETAELPGISKESPLYPWKMLVRTLAAFYANDVQSCSDHLCEIESDTPPHRLVPVISAMLPNGSKADLARAEAALADQIAAAAEELVDSIGRLRRTVEETDGRKISQTAKSAFELCRKTRPDLLQELQEAFLTSAVAVGFCATSLLPLLIEPMEFDSALWGRLARTAETAGYGYDAAVNWLNFKNASILEGRFSEDAPDTAAVQGRIVNQLRRFTSWDLERSAHVYQDFLGKPEYRGILDRLVGKPGRTELLRDEEGPLEPEVAFETLCKLNPAATNYRIWLDWVCSAGGGYLEEEEDVALAWHRALPMDSEPILYLAEAAEKRKAYQKALNYLKMGKAAIRLNERAGSVLRRVMVARTLRHLGGSKRHLMERDLDELSALPEMAEGGRPAVLLGLRWACAARWVERARAGELQGKLEKLLFSSLAAVMLLKSIREFCWMDYISRYDLRPAPAKESTLASIRATTGVWSICREFGLVPTLPSELEKPFVAFCDRRDGRVLTAELLSLGELSLASRLSKLAYAASGAGLASGERIAEFLLLRARNHDWRTQQRKNQCYAAAVTLARGEDRADLIELIADSLKGEYVASGRTVETMVKGTGPLMVPEKVLEVVRREAGALDYPATHRDDFSVGAYGPRAEEEDRNEYECDCVECRRKRGESASDYDYDFDCCDEDGDWDEDYDDWGRGGRRR